MIDDCDKEIAEIKMDFEVLARPATTTTTQVTSEGLKKALTRNSTTNTTTLFT